MKLSLIGGCLCRAIRYECSAEPILSYKCHCRDCQRTGGSGFLPLLWVHEDALRLTGAEPRYFAVNAESGRQFKRGFCTKCGSTVLCKPDAPLIFIVASSLDDPAVYAPDIEIWTSSAQPWDILDPSLRHFLKQIPDEEVRKLAHF